MMLCHLNSEGSSRTITSCPVSVTSVLCITRDALSLFGSLTRTPLISQMGRRRPRSPSMTMRMRHCYGAKDENRFIWKKGVRIDEGDSSPSEVKRTVRIVLGLEVLHGDTGSENRRLIQLQSTLSDVQDSVKQSQGLSEQPASLSHPSIETVSLLRRYPSELSALAGERCVSAPSVHLASSLDLSAAAAATNRVWILSPPTRFFPDSPSDKAFTWPASSVNCFAELPAWETHSHSEERHSLL